MVATTDRGSVGGVPSIRSERVVIDGDVRPATIEIAEGRIVSIGSGSVADHDFGSLVVMPGLVDSHVHVNDPGRSDWEGFASATRAAAAGGSTTIVDMPLNSIPPTTSLENLASKRRAAGGQMAVDVAFWGGIVPGSAVNVPSLVQAGVCGFKAFLVDSGVPEFPPLSEDQLEAAMSAVAGRGVPVLIHAEDPGHLLEPDGDPTSYPTYLTTRPVEAETAAVETVARIAAETGAAGHILHVSSGPGAQLLVERGITGETCPHYLTFAAEEIPDRATQYKCAPPIRGGEHREALWDALGEGVLGMVVSDHSPAPDSLKEVGAGDFIEAWGGISGLQLRLQATWTGASARGYQLTDLAEWLSAAPARLAGIFDRKGSIEVGKDADFVVWDPDAITEVRGDLLQHRHSLTPYEGMTLRGGVVLTMLRGEQIFLDGEVRTSHGRMLRRR